MLLFKLPLNIRNYMSLITFSSYEFDKSLLKRAFINTYIIRWVYNNDITLETSNVMWYLTCSITLFALLYSYFLTTNITHLDQLLNMWLHLNEQPLNGSFYLKWKTVSFTIYDNNKLKHSDIIYHTQALCCVQLTIQPWSKMLDHWSRKHCLSYIY